MGRNRPLYLISTVAKMLNIHPQTLRLYEREGLIKPSRTEGNTRLYSQEDVERLHTILTLTRDLGVNLAGVEIILRMREQIEELQSEVEKLATLLGRYMQVEIERLQEESGTALVRVAPSHVVRVKISEKEKE